MQALSDDILYRIFGELGVADATRFSSVRGVVIYGCEGRDASNTTSGHQCRCCPSHRVPAQCSSLCYKIGMSLPQLSTRNRTWQPQRPRSGCTQSPRTLHHPCTGLDEHAWRARATSMWPTETVSLSPPSPYATYRVRCTTPSLRVRHHNVHRTLCWMTTATVLTGVFPCSDAPRCTNTIGIMHTMSASCCTSNGAEPVTPSGIV